MADQGPAGDRAYRHTKELILTGELAGGQLFSEGEIANDLDISRTPVREAFLRLEAEQLVQLIPKRGAVVVPVTPTEMEDVLDLREALEAAAVRRLLRDDRLLAAASEGWSRALEEQRRCAQERDADGFAAADDAFHASFVEGSGNALAIRFYRSLGDRQRRMSLSVVRPRAELLDVLLQEHAALAECVERREPEAFARGLGEHLDRYHRR
ncbi:GntR family transcriptional regulator [Kribbella sp. NPDC051770]|uniref:GntR family transcriptional regulator n=1 Tax=Kribbella sp. NPDC051770 TaxID=3155413 RepID=UPI0034268E5C